MAYVVLIWDSDKFPAMLRQIYGMFDTAQDADEWAKERLTAPYTIRAVNLP